MTRSEFRLFVARETAIGILISTVVSTAPGLIFDSTMHAQAVRDVPIGLTPQILMNGLMSALVPSLRLWQVQSAQRAAAAPNYVRRIAVITVLLAAGSTMLTLALIHLLVVPFASEGIGVSAILVLRASEAALAAATVTPFALTLLAKGVCHGQASGAGYRSRTSACERGAKVLEWPTWVDSGPSWPSDRLGFV